MLPMTQCPQSVLHPNEHICRPSVSLKPFGLPIISLLFAVNTVSLLEKGQCQAHYSDPDFLLVPDPRLFIILFSCPVNAYLSFSHRSYKAGLYPDGHLCFECSAQRWAFWFWTIILSWMCPKIAPVYCVTGLLALSPTGLHCVNNHNHHRRGQLNPNQFQKKAERGNLF